MDKKSIICASLAAAILYTSAAIALEKQSHTAYASSVSIIYGDVDQNNTIDSFDALTTLRASAKITSLSALQTAIADVDGDEVITASDALDILRFSAGMRPSYHTGQSDNLDTPELDSRLPLTVDSDKENSSASSSSSTGTSSKETSSSNTSSKTTSSHTTSSNTHDSSNTTTSNTSSKTTSSHGSTSSNTSSKTTSSKATSSQNTSSKTTSSKVTSSQNTSSKTTSSNNTSSKVTSSQTTSSHNTSSTTTSSQNTSSTEPQHTDTEEVVETTRTNCIAWVYCPICDTLIFDGVRGGHRFDSDPECYDHGGTLDDKFRFREPINGTPIYEDDVMIVYECIDDRPAFQVKTQDGHGRRTHIPHIHQQKCKRWTNGHCTSTCRRTC